MTCPHCTTRLTFVIETRQAGPNLRRRRECSMCHFRWSTMEIPVGSSVPFEARVSLDGLIIQPAGRKTTGRRKPAPGKL